ncbi:MAG TPA: DUF4253 domain-containing protein [Peptococcaceae bacterium]|nr:DUF4253 domain-containing protein [Peptococcaceae bacterium]
MKIIITGFVWAMAALLGYYIYEWLRNKLVKGKHFKAMAEEFKFSEEVSNFIWEKAKHSVLQLLAYDKKGNEKYVHGFEIPKISDTFMQEIQAGLPRGYFTFICDFDQKHKRLGIIKGNEQYAILRTMQTNGENYNLSNGKLISELRSIEKIAPFSIIGAGFDWLELAFTKLEESGEVDKVCQAIVDKVMKIAPPQEDEAQFRKQLIEELKSTQKLFLWWPS